MKIHPFRARRFTAARIVTLLLSAALTLTVAVSLVWAATVKFQEIVTETVVRKVAEEAVDYVFKGYEAKYGLGFRRITYSARRTAYVNYPDFGKRYYEREKLKQTVFDAVKKHLSDPENLRRAYRKYKLVVIGEVIRQQKE